MKKRAVSLLLTLALLCSLLAVPASAAGYTKCYLGSGYGTTYNIDFILSHGQHPAVEFFDADEADITNGKSSCFYYVANGCRISIDVREGTQSSSSVTVIPCTSTFTDDSTVTIQQHDESWTLSDGDILDERTFGGYNTLCCIGSYRDYRYAFYFYLDPNSSDVTTPDAGDQGTGSKPEQPEQPEPPAKPETHIHVWDTTTIPSTCTQPGKKIRTCTRCGAEETEPLLTLATHRWRSDYTPITCEKDGVMTRTCTVCGKEEITKTYPTTGHQYTEQIIRPATAEQEGLKKLTCTRCGDIRQEAIPKLGHGTGNGTVNGNFSSDYMAGRFYRALQNVTLSGNYRNDMIAVAESQIGYHEGDAADQIDGSYQGSGDYTEYGRYLGSNGNAWCSEFASWCARIVGVPTSILANSKGANVKTFAAPYHHWDETVYAGGSYTPQAGDLALFAWSGTSETAASLSHTAIVHSVKQSGNRVFLTVVHGNSGNEVCKKTFTVDAADGAVSSGKIVYFVAPNYSEGEAGDAGANNGKDRKSGSTTMKKLSQSEITRLLADNPLDLPDNVLDSMPSCTAPFAAGSVKTEALQAAANRLNALRRIAGLPDVTLDLSLCEEAQYGAVIQGHYGALDHYPSKPAGMSDAFYQRAYAASSSSNLYAGRTLTTAVDGWMNDSDQTNVDRLGHRRWQLNPALGKVGFGYAEANTRYHTYLAEKVLDKSGSGCEYDFISWPASGNFPAELFGKNIAWSVSLNPMEYQTPRQSDLTVTLTREADGKVWTFRGSSYAPTDSGNYFRVDTGGYGIPNCIIFRPDGIQTYDGIYTVQIQGLKTRNGQSVKDFAYQVEFFGADPQDRPSVPVQPEKPTQPEKPSQGTGFRDVPAGAYYADAVTWAVKEGITSGTSANTFSPNLSCTRAQMVTFLWRANGSPRASRANRFTDVSANAYYYDAVLWAAENGITSGSSATTFSPDAVLTRGQTVTFLYRAAGSPTVSGSSFRDVAPGAWYANAVAWAVSKGVTTGTGGNHFSPDAPCTRAQTVTFLYRDAQ